MHINILVGFFMVIVTIGAAQAVPESSRVTTASITITGGASVINVPLRAQDLATLNDVCRRLNASVIAVTMGDRWRAIMAGSVEAREYNVHGNESYLVFASRGQTVVVSGVPWSASELIRSIPRGISLVRFFRPPIEDAETVRRALGLSAILVRRPDRSSIQWQPIAIEGQLLQLVSLSGADSYALISTTTMPRVVLPNSNHPPRVRIAGIPLAATRGTTLTLESNSVDDDPGDEELSPLWNVFSGNTTTSAVGQSIVVSMTLDPMRVEHSCSDGLVTDRTTQSVAVIESATATTHQEIRTGFGPFALNVFGVRAQLPSLKISGRLPPSAFGYRVGYDKATVPFLGTVHIDVEEAVPYLEQGTNREPLNFPLPITVSVDVGSSPTADILVRNSLVYDVQTGQSTTFDYYAFSQEAVAKTNGVSKGPIAWARTWMTQLGVSRRQFVPVSLQNMVSSDAGYAIEPVNPDLALDDRIVVPLLSGIDFKSELCGAGQTIPQALARWNCFTGIDATSPKGIAENLRDLEQWFAFYRCAYPTTRSPKESAEKLSTMLKATVLGNGDGRVIIFGYSMGGIVGRYFQNLLDGVEWLVTIGTPHHGSSIATALKGRYFDTNFFLKRAVPQSQWPLLQYGCIPPSDGLASLVYDASWKDSNGQSLFPNRNPTLSTFNERDDAHRRDSNVTHVAGGTGDIPFPDPGYEVARQIWRQPIGLVEHEDSDGAVSLESALPKDLHGSQKGSTDPFFGWTDWGTADRVSYNNGLDHQLIIRHPTMMCRYHTFLSQYIDHTNHAPRDDTPQLVTLETEDPSIDLATIESAVDPDGDSVFHAWSLHRVIPADAHAELHGTIVTVSAPGNAILYHTVRDGRGGIVAQIIVVYRPAPPTDSFCRSASLALTLGVQADQTIHWSLDPRGCIPSDPRRYTLWIDPTDDTTKIAGDNFQVYGAHRWWSDREIYGFYDGPGITNSQRVVTNVAVGKSQHAILLGR